MAFQPAPNCAEAYVQSTVNGKIVGFGLKFHFITGNYTQSDIDALASAVDAWMGASYLPNMSGEAVYNETQVRGLQNVIDLAAVDNANAGAGALGGEALPVNVSWVLKFTTGFTGRSARGRVYTTGCDTTWLAANENEITPTHAANMVLVFEDIPNQLTGTGWEHVVLSRYSLGIKRPSATFLPVTGYSYTDLRVDTRRKRLGK